MEEQAISLVGTDIYEKLIKSYTEKQWEKPCTELPAFIIRRLPVRLTYDNDYFNDTFQGIPIGGYTHIVEKMLDHDNIDVETNVDFFANKEDYLATYPKIVFTGMIDEFFDYQLGELEYRSLRFETEVLDVENYQGYAVVNYTDSETPLLVSSNTNILNLVHNRKPLLHVSIRRPGNEAMSRIIQSTMIVTTNSILLINASQNNKRILYLVDVLVIIGTMICIKSSELPCSV